MWDDLLLLRLWAAPDPAHGETRSRAAADLRPVAADPAQGQGSWQAAFTAALERLEKAGHLTAQGRRGARLRLTDQGRSRVRATFRLAGESPAHRHQTGWAWWRDRYAVPLALDSEDAATANGLRAALLRRFFLPELPARAAGAGSLSGLVDLLLAQRLKVAQPGLRAFRQAALRDRARQEAAPEPAAASPANSAAGGDGGGGGLAADLPVFAAHALAAARRSPTGRFGDNKVFISHVWREWRGAGGRAAPEEAAAFKEQLVRANTAGLLRLSRADLAGAHDPADVRESQISYLGEKFHFVRLD